MSYFSRLIRTSVIGRLFKDIQNENRSNFERIETLPLSAERREFEALGNNDNDSIENSLKSQEFDLIISPNEICQNHGTGVLLRRLFGKNERLINIRSRTHYHAESLGKVQLEIAHESQTRSIAFLRVAKALCSYRIKQIICVPFYPDDAITAIAAHEITGAPLCLYLMDDQNIHFPGIPDSLIRELIEKSNVRFAIGPEMRDAYEMKYGHKIWILPPLVPPDFIDGAVRATASSAIKSCVLMGNIWSPSWMNEFRQAVRQSGLIIHWYGNTAQHVPPGDEGQWADDGIHVHGFVEESELLKCLHKYQFAVVPVGSSNPDDEHQWQAKLSAPSRIPFLMAVAHIPILVVSNSETPAANMIRSLKIGRVCDYSPEAFKATAEAICEPEAQRAYRTNSAALAPAFSSEGIHEWIWQSLEAGEPIDRRFENLFKRTSQFSPTWIDTPLPGGLHWEFSGFYIALSRLREAGFSPDFVIDVGSSTGIWSDLCHKVFPLARYTLIDPLMSRYRIKSTWYYDQHPEFDCVEAAVSNEEGTMDFHVSEDMYGSSLMKDVDDGRVYDLVTVPVVTLDGLASSRNYGGSGLLKLDVQFAEHLALEGAVKLLKNVSVIMVELTFQRLSKDSKTFLEMLNWLDELGFRYFDEAGGWRSPINGIPIQQDVVFVKKGLLHS